MEELHADIVEIIIVPTQSTWLKDIPIEVLYLIEDWGHHPLDLNIVDALRLTDCLLKGKADYYNFKTYKNCKTFTANYNYALYLGLQGVLESQ